MNSFTFHIPTDIRFGKGQVKVLPEELKKYGKKVLMVYGGGSIKKTGLYGLECFHPSASEEDSKRVVDIAHRTGLKITFGSDYHGPQDKKRA